MNLRNLARGRLRSSVSGTKAYALWRAYRRHQQLRRFNALLHSWLDERTSGGPYSEALIKERLQERQHERRRCFGPDGKPVVVAFGSSVWEQYGLWPSFERVAHFALLEFGMELSAEVLSRPPTDEMRHRLAESFLSLIDTVDRERAVTVAFFYASGEFISSELLEELARRGIWTIIMSLDDKQQFPVGVHRREESHQLRVARECDLYWTTWRTGAQIVLDAGGTGWYAPEAADPTFHHPLNLHRDIELLFIGQAYGFRTDLVDYLRKHGFHVETYGAGWPQGFLSFEQAVGLYSRAHIVLGVGGVGHMDGVKHLKGRDFEVPMCGSLYLTTYNPELADHFRIGQEILCYSSPEECADLAHWVLRHPDEAKHVREAALARSLGDHTWEHRLRQMMSLFVQS